MKTTSRINCEQCNVCRINGVVCHETGCSRSWIDPETGEGYPVPCWECGCDFVPEDRPTRYSSCPDCCNRQEIGDDCCDFDFADE